jgi:hypothetical protein
MVLLFLSLSLLSLSSSNRREKAKTESGKRWRKLLPVSRASDHHTVCSIIYTIITIINHSTTAIASKFHCYTIDYNMETTAQQSKSPIPSHSFWLRNPQDIVSQRAAYTFAATPFLNYAKVQSQLRSIFCRFNITF